MKNKFFLFFVIFSCTMYSSSYAQDKRSVITEKSHNDESAGTVTEHSHALNWVNSLFFASGYGYPQGYRAEIGYNIGENFSLGFTFDIFDYWSGDSGEGQPGILLKLSFPIDSSPLSPYIFYNYGGFISIFGEPDTYNLFYIGMMIPVKSWLHVRPEVGVVFTSKHINGGSSLFGGSSPEITENKTRIGVNLSFEIDF